MGTLMPGEMFHMASEKCDEINVLQVPTHLIFPLIHPHPHIFLDSIILAFISTLALTGMVHRSCRSDPGIKATVTLSPHLTTPEEMLLPGPALLQGSPPQLSHRNTFDSIPDLDGAPSVAGTVIIHRLDEVWMFGEVWGMHGCSISVNCGQRDLHVCNVRVV